MMDETSEENPGQTGARDSKRQMNPVQDVNGRRERSVPEIPTVGRGWGIPRDLLGSPPPWLKFTGSGCHLEAKLENPGQRLLS